MRKMKLDIDRLAVESFVIKDADTGERGTVRGNAATLRCSAAPTACVPDTCAFSCIGSCVNGQQVC